MNHVTSSTFNMIGAAHGLMKSLKLSLKQSLVGFFHNYIEKNRRVILNTHTHRECVNENLSEDVYNLEMSEQGTALSLSPGSRQMAATGTTGTV